MELPALAAFARQQGLDPSNELTDHEVVFVLLVRSVKSYAAEWERIDLDRAEKRPLSTVPDEDLTMEGAMTGEASLGDLTPVTRWQLTLTSIAENLEMDTDA